MNAKLKLLMNEFHIDETDGVFSSIPSSPSTQSDEIKLRQEVASSQYDDYLTAISKSHSIPVMDYEIKRFLSLVPLDGVILDIGGCWGWHWRKLHQQRPDVSVVIVDFVRENFEHTKRTIKSKIIFVSPLQVVYFFLLLRYHLKALFLKDIK